ncbi:hydantoinase B/oxoprolinase family protein [Bradyrhizobium arachidis]|nr:hydantoinase B/oxoprolinase family protein [Bradyrhizobium arachidis]
MSASKSSSSGADDPVLLAIVQKQLDHITRQMGWIMTRTARSPLFSESHDFSCFLGTTKGEIASQADGLPIHSGAGGFALRAVLDAFGDDIESGDVFILNDPYVAGGNHLPDWTVVRPLFVDGKLAGFAANRAHQSDIGGGAAGTYNPEATEIFHEGLRLPVMRLVERNKLRRDVQQMLLLNSRCPDLMEGDLGAMLGSVRIGANQMEDLLAGLASSRGTDYLDAVIEYGERRMTRAIAALPDGAWYGEDGSDTDCFGPIEVPIKVKLTVEKGALTFDFTGSSPQTKGFKNSSIANTHSAVYVAVASFFDASVPRNGGTFRPVKIIAPEGSVVNPIAPAAMTMNTVFPSVEIIHACWKALAQTNPSRACAGWGKGVSGISSGRYENGRSFVLYHWHASAGGGAVDGRDGFLQGGNLPTLAGRIMPNVEAYERIYPCRIHRHELRCDSGGAGQFRGGPSADYDCEILVPSSLSVLAEGLHRPSGYGVHGADWGAKGTMIVQEPDQESASVPQYGIRHFSGPVRVVIQGTAGGGWGQPMRRSIDRVLRDVRDGLVSVDAARAQYGVVLKPGHREVDLAATNALREKAR